MDSGLKSMKGYKYEVKILYIHVLQVELSNAVWKVDSNYQLILTSPVIEMLYFQNT